MALLEDKKEFDFIWKIDNFSMMPQQNGIENALASPEFVVDFWEGIKWHLELYPRGHWDEDHVACLLYATATEIKDFKFKFSLTLESTDPNNEKTLKTDESVQNLVKARGWNIISMTELHSKKKYYLPQDILSLRCHFSPMDSNYEELPEKNKIESATSSFKQVYISRTGIQVQQKAFTWSIPNISTRSERVEETFMIKHILGLKVILNFSEVANNVSIPIEIQQTSTPLDEKQERLFVKCKITVVGVDKEYQDSKEDTHLFKLALNDVWHFPLFIKTSNLTLGKYLKRKDTLFLHCEFAVSYETGVYHCDANPSSIGSTKKHEKSNWCTSVQNLYASGKFSDVEIKAGGEIFPAHKLVLCARSTVFSAMFENDMKEKNSGVVEIKDVDPSTLKRMLTFINFDDIKEEDLSSEDLCDLYAAADKYNVVSLKDWCTKSLLLTLSVESVYDILVLADAHQDNIFMTKIYNFMCCHETEIFDSTDWESLIDSNPKLSAKVMHQVLVKRKRI